MTDSIVGLVLAIHLVFVNLAAAGPLVVIWLEWKEGRGSAIAGMAGRKLALWSMLALVAGSLIGLAGFVLLWNDDYRAVLTSLKTRVIYGGWELLFSFALMLLHYLWWRKVEARPKRGRWIRCLMLLLAGSNLAYHFPPLLIIASQLIISPSPLEGVIPSSEFRQLMTQGVVLSRTTHFLLASLAVCGVTMMMFSAGFARKGVDQSERLAVWGGRLAPVPTLLQLGVGVWVLLELPAIQQKQLMGSDLFSTVVFLFSLIAAFALMHMLASVAMGKGTPSTINWCVALLLITILLMTIAMRRSRSTLPSSRFAQLHTQLIPHQ